jgi:hypothetical protein
VQICTREFARILIFLFETGKSKSAHLVRGVEKSIAQNASNGCPLR